MIDTLPFGSGPEIWVNLSAGPLLLQESEHLISTKTTTLTDSAQAAAAGAIATSTYLAFVAIEAVGFPVSFLISPPEKVTRSDGVPIVLAARKPIRAEMVLLWKAVIHPRMLLLTPIAFYSYFAGGTLSTYLTLYFTVRARALSS